jgi:hypothetical protein
VLDSIAGIFGSAPFLYRSASGYFVSYFQGDAEALQVLVWIGMSGAIQHQQSLPLVGINYVFMRGDTAVLVEYKQEHSEEPSWHAVITHAFPPDQSPPLLDTLFRENIAYDEILLNPAFDARNGELLAVINTFRMTNEGVLLDYRSRFLRASAGSVFVGERQTLYPAPAAGDLYRPGLAASADGGAVLGYSWSVGSQVQLCFRSFDADGNLRSTIHSQTLEGDDWINMFDLVSRNQTVYACYNQGSYDLPRRGTFIMAFPEAEFMPVAPEPDIARNLDLGIYPNPFNGTTRIRFDLPVSGEANLSVFDVNGRRVADLEQGFLTAGEHGISWNAERLPTGIYYVRLLADRKMQIRKALLIR